MAVQVEDRNCDEWRAAACVKPAARPMRLVIFDSSYRFRENALYPTGSAWRRASCSYMRSATSPTSGATGARAGKRR